MVINVIIIVVVVSFMTQPPLTTMGVGAIEEEVLLLPLIRRSHGSVNFRDPLQLLLLIKTSVHIMTINPLAPSLYSLVKDVGTTNHHRKW